MYQSNWVVTQAADPKATFMVALVVYGGDLYICYVDEAGCTGGLPDASSSIQPAFVISGIIMEQECIHALTYDFLNIKKHFFKRLFSGLLDLDCMIKEIKGSDVRKLIKGTRNQNRHALKFIDEIIRLLEKYNAKIIGRVWIKPFGFNAFTGKSVYTSSIQHIAAWFQSFLLDKNTNGVIIADSRDKGGNTIVSHSVFTQKYRYRGDAYDRILEVPVFGHSDNHAGLQLADLLVSAIIFPISTTVYCSGYLINTTHHHPQYLSIRQRFGVRLEILQYRFQGSDRTLGGITVSDPLGHKNGSKIFRT
ncbi:DUF3800 domain-containing protein [Candidatus Magnetominusculus xianensis]|uniref:DUF3800 domain-containing protein n=1 Tax=Candidatus Magnetominusculus xianensis TaxID=1748249 RepID=A0ABR5SEW0_9BACT|nr:DUF3800 domain-containing protein [Candidatus Magnetominusculus xianensis]KWT82976.1 hypothetical protein ASN18_2337 [Candidatus Magnetominusculus xianensis]MBF0403055.1 DUF3800 domain-containing protein [Nitrospirota bacterium]